MKRTLLLILSLFFFVSLLQAQVKKSSAKKKTTVSKIVPDRQLQNVRIKIITDSGIIIVKLSDSTPHHRDNFVKLVRQGFYDSLLFHRVIPNFMIQGGDPKSRHAEARKLLGDGDDSLATIPAEFRTDLIHKRGVFAAARDGDDVNPTKASSASQFYIVTGKKFTDAQLDQVELRMNKLFTPEQRTAYTTIGGAPWLDGAYTIFGEVESGMEVADKISKLARDSNDRPLADMRMKIEVMQ